MYRWKALILFVVLSFAVCSSVSAQSESTNTGNFMISGAMSFTSVDREGTTERTNVWTMIPTGMYFPADNFAVGLEANFLGISTGDVGVSTHRWLAIGQFVIPTSNAMMRPFVTGGGGLVRMTNEDPAGNIIQNGWGLKGGVGLHMFLNDHVSVTPQVSYIYESFGEDGTVPSITMQSVFVSIGITGFIH